MGRRVKKISVFKDQSSFPSPQKIQGSSPTNTWKKADRSIRAHSSHMELGLLLPPPLYRGGDKFPEALGGRWREWGDAHRWSPS